MHGEDGVAQSEGSGNSFGALVGEFYADIRRPLMKDVRKISVSINGCEYHNLEEVPPELRAIYSKAVETAGELEAKGGGGIGINFGCFVGKGDV